MKTILITGSKGQLGSEIKFIAETNQLADIKFVFTDIEELDISNINNLKIFFKKYNIDYIVNCAAYTNVDKAESENEKAELINSTAVKNLANISKTDNIPIIHISTDYVFSGSKEKAYAEDDDTGPVTVYGKTKLNGEQHVLSAYKYIVIRTSWLYSKYGHNFVKTMLKLGKEKNQINVVNDQKGSPTNAADLAEAIMKIIISSAENGENFISGIYHYSNEGNCTWYEFAAEIMKMSNLNCIVSPVSSIEFPTPAKRPAFSLMDKTKIKKTFSLDIPYWKDSLQKFLNEFSS